MTTPMLRQRHLATLADVMPAGICPREGGRIEEVKQALGELTEARKRRKEKRAKLRPPVAEDGLKLPLGDLVPGLREFKVPVPAGYERQLVTGLLRSWTRKVQEAIARSLLRAQEEAAFYDEKHEEEMRGFSRVAEEHQSRSRQLWAIARELEGRTDWCWKDEIEDLLTPVERVFLGEEQGPDGRWTGGYWKGDRDVRRQGARPVEGRRFVSLELLAGIANRRFGLIMDALDGDGTKEDLADAVDDLRAALGNEGETIMKDAVNDKGKGKDAGKAKGRGRAPGADPARERMEVRPEDVGTLDGAALGSIRTEMNGPTPQPPPPRVEPPAPAFEPTLAMTPIHQATDSWMSVEEETLRQAAALDVAQQRFFVMLEFFEQAVKPLRAEFTRAELEKRLGVTDGIEGATQAMATDILAVVPWVGAAGAETATRQQVRRAMVQRHVKALAF